VSSCLPSIDEWEFPRHFLKVSRACYLCSWTCISIFIYWGKYLWQSGFTSHFQNDWRPDGSWFVQIVLLRIAHFDIA